MPSFDIVSEVDMQEVDNAVNQAAKEISTRFDFRGSNTKVQLDKTKKSIMIHAGDEIKLRSVHTILESKMVKRGLDLRILDYKDKEEASGREVRQTLLLKEGIEKDSAKVITKKIKETKLKVQAQIQDQQVRVTGKKIDDLQDVIQMLKEANVDFPLQFINMRT